MNEMFKKTVSMLAVLAVAFLLAFPFVPAAASGGQEAGPEAKSGEVEAETSAGDPADTEDMAVETAMSGDEGESAPQGVGEAVADEGAQEPPEKETASGADSTAEGSAGAMTVHDGDHQPWEVTSLDIRKDVDVVRAPGWEIGLEKTASESHLEMQVGEKSDVAFTIHVDASAGDRYYIAGNIFVENTGDWPADVIAVSDTVWYKAGGPGWLPAASSITTNVPLGDDAIPTGGPHVYSYSGTFTIPVPLAGVTAMSNLIEITISNKPKPPKPGMQNWTFHYRKSFAKPQDSAPGVVSLEDMETIDPASGLGYLIKSATINGSPASSLTGPWSLDLAEAPFTLVIEKELSAEAAGSYVLNNKARIGDLEDEVDVVIEVKEEEVRPGVITGAKYVDLDADGELDEGEPGLEGVTIRLFRVDLVDEVVVAATSLSHEGLALVGETATDENGDFAFHNLQGGLYLVEEEVPEGYYPTSANPIEVWVVEGQDVQVAFLNARKARVGGEKLDYSTQLPVAGVRFTLEGEEFYAEAVSDEDGGFDFGWLMPGSYTLREEVPSGWMAVTDTEIALELASGDEFHQVFVNRRLSGVFGFKWLDANGDGIHQDGEAAVEGVKIILQAEGVLEERITDAGGFYSFEGLLDGQYLVKEEVPEGHYATAAVEVGLFLAAGEERRVDFINAPLAMVAGTKWLDLNANGGFDEGEQGLQGVTVRLYDGGGELLAATTTASDGTYEFRELRGGAYRVEEVVPEGYVATSPVSVSFDLLPGEEKRVDFHNNVAVAGEIVTPPAQPPQPEQQAQQQGTLPRTGFDATYLMMVFGALMLAGLFLVSIGAARSARSR